MGRWSFGIWPWVSVCERLGWSSWILHRSYGFIWYIHTCKINSNYSILMPQSCTQRDWSMSSLIWAKPYSGLAGFPGFGLQEVRVYPNSWQFHIISSGRVGLLQGVGAFLRLGQLHLCLWDRAATDLANTNFFIANRRSFYGKIMQNLLILQEKNWQSLSMSCLRSTGLWLWLSLRPGAVWNFGTCAGGVAFQLQAADSAGEPTVNPC